MDGLTTASGIAALAAAALALLALLCCAVLWRRLRALRESQRVVLGEGGQRDLVAHADAIERRLAGLGEKMEAELERLSHRDAELARRLDGAVTHCAVVRYDALGEMTGRQSSSVALLDSHRSGVVLSSILHRDQARLYAKQIVAGDSEFALSPEEEQVLDEALGGHREGQGV